MWKWRENGKRRIVSANGFKDNTTKVDSQMRQSWLDFLDYRDYRHYCIHPDSPDYIDYLDYLDYLDYPDYLDYLDYLDYEECKKNRLKFFFLLGDTACWKCFTPILSTSRQNMKNARKQIGKSFFFLKSMQWSQTAVQRPLDLRVGTVSESPQQLLRQTWWNSEVKSSRSPCCVLLALSWNTTTNENPSTDKLSRAIN